MAGRQCVGAAGVCVLCLRAPYIAPTLPHCPAITTPRAGDENPGRIAADIVFVLQERPHPVFKREGNDLVYTHRWGWAGAGGGGAAAWLMTFDCTLW
jgi:DnaJ-class molecular chaperone